MSRTAPRFSVIPEDTERVANAAFPTGHRYLHLRDTFGALCSIANVRHFVHDEGRPGIDPARLAGITIL
jgi:transposase